MLLRKIEGTCDNTWKDESGLYSIFTKDYTLVRSVEPIRLELVFTAPEYSIQVPEKYFFCRLGVFGDWGVTPRLPKAETALLYNGFLQEFKIEEPVELEEVVDRSEWVKILESDTALFPVPRNFPSDRFPMTIARIFAIEPGFLEKYYETVVRVNKGTFVNFLTAEQLVKWFRSITHATLSSINEQMEFLGLKESTKHIISFSQAMSDLLKTTTSIQQIYRKEGFQRLYINHEEHDPPSSSSNMFKLILDSEPEVEEMLKGLALFHKTRTYYHLDIKLLSARHLHPTFTEYNWTLCEAIEMFIGDTLKDPKYQKNVPEMYKTLVSLLLQPRFKRIMEDEQLVKNVFHFAATQLLCWKIAKEGSEGDQKLVNLLKEGPVRFGVEDICSSQFVSPLLDTDASSIEVSLTYAGLMRAYPKGSDKREFSLNLKDELLEMGLVRRLAWKESEQEISEEDKILVERELLIQGDFKNGRCPNECCRMYSMIVESYCNDALPPIEEIYTSFLKCYQNRSPATGLLWLALKHRKTVHGLEGFTQQDHMRCLEILLFSMDSLPLDATETFLEELLDLLEEAEDTTGLIWQIKAKIKQRQMEEYECLEMFESGSVEVCSDKSRSHGTAAGSFVFLTMNSTPSLLPPELTQKELINLYVTYVRSQRKGSRVYAQGHYPLEKELRKVIVEHTEECTRLEILQELFGDEERDKADHQ